MPLEKGPVGSEAFKHNIKTEIAVGKPQKQAVAIAYRLAGERRDDGMDIGKLDAVAGALERLDGRLDAMEKRRSDGGDEPGKGEDPYGDVKYADPGYQPDHEKRYPIDTQERIRAAWNYIHKIRDEDKYSPKQREEIERRIVAAWKAKIGGEPPEAAKR